MPTEMLPSDSLDEQSSVLLWRPDGDYVLIVVINADGGVMADRLIALFIWQKHRWVRMTNNTTSWLYKTMFSDRGGFSVKGNRLFIWDFVFDERHALFSPARYKLRIFTWFGGLLRGPAILTTRRKYDVTILSYTNQRKIKSQDDPLFEFGNIAKKL